MSEQIRSALAVVLGKTESPAMPMHEALAQLDAIAADKSLELPGEMRHYLQRRSYAKAWAMYEANSASTGCKN